MGLGIGVGEFLEWQDAAQSSNVEEKPTGSVVKHLQNATEFPWHGGDGKLGYTVEETFMPYKLRMISM